MDSGQDFGDRIKRQMNDSGIHDAWEAMYRSDDNERFYELAYAKLFKKLGQPRDALALDIGCGIGANTVRLARQGYRVVAADYSEAILPETKRNMERHGVADRVTIQREDITALTFPDGHFDLTLCWGVLMHIPAVDAALAELARVTKPGGYLVLAEVNPSSPEARTLRGYWRTLKRDKVSIEHKPCGFEHTSRFNDEALFWRHLDRDWTTKQLGGYGFEPAGRFAGHLIETFHYFKNAGIRNAIQALNRFYFSNIGAAALSSTQVLIYRKR
ncbi:MAG: class I SAM-dependent methyltransferase [Sphingomonadales bacterium]